MVRKSQGAQKSQGTQAGKGNVPTFGAVTKDTRGARDQLLSGINKVQILFPLSCQNISAHQFINAS